jgi:sugar diacid utilization regulator
LLAVAADRPLGDEDDELLRGVGHQLAVALKKAELIERLTAENVVRELFEALEADVPDVAEARARVAGCDLTRRHVVVEVEPPAGHDDPRPWPAVAERVEARVRRLFPDALCDAGRDSLRALLPLQSGEPGDAFASLCESLRQLGAAEKVLVGVAEPRRGVSEGRRGLSEAADSVQIARALLRGGGALAYRDLGVYRYLVRLPPGEAPDDRHHEAVARLLEYDRKRRSELVPTLEQYLRDRRSITTARALYIHPNTLRQRLERIEKLSGLDLANEDLMSLELALKLANLRAAR